MRRRLLVATALALPLCGCGGDGGEQSGEVFRSTSEIRTQIEEAGIDCVSDEPESSDVTGGMFISCSTETFTDQGIDRQGDVDRIAVYPDEDSAREGAEYGMEVNPGRQVLLGRNWFIAAESIDPLKKAQAVLGGEILEQTNYLEE
jgi:hypothetical protein